MRTRRQALGQHFLHHKPTIEKILSEVDESLAAHTPDALLEIGPGGFALTAGLMARAQNHNLPLLIVERDRYLEPSLRHNITSRATPQSPPVELHFMDAATEKFLQFMKELKDRRLQKILVISNLPYSAASQILANLCYTSDQLTQAVVMTQKEMAERMAAIPGQKTRGSFSILIECYFSAKKCFDVAPGAFKPAPQVMSTVLTLTPRRPSAVATLATPQKFEVFCKQIFSQRRKMIRKILPQKLQPHFPKLGISGTERPETLSLAVLLQLYGLASEEETLWDSPQNK